MKRLLISTNPICIDANTELYASVFCKKILKDADFDDIVISMTGISRGMIAVEGKMKRIAINEKISGELSSQVQHSIIKDLIGRSPT